MFKIDKIITKQFPIPSIIGVDMVRKNRKRKFLSHEELQKLLLHVKKQADLARERGTTRAVIDEIIIQLLANVGLRANEMRVCA